MMVSHFHEQVIAKGKIGGQARAMIITSSIERCIEYYHAVNQCLATRHSPYKAIIAFSGEKQLDKSCELVHEIKKWVDEEYAGGRVTVLTDEEIVACIHRVCLEQGMSLEQYIEK